MSPRLNPWEEIPKGKRSIYHPLVETFAPAVRLKPFDLWINFRVRYRVAILKSKYRGKHISRIQLAIHYVWDAPSLDGLKILRPNWAATTAKRWFERFERHVKRWGPGDIELVRLILQRVPTVHDLDMIAASEFRIDEIKFRTGAHAKGVIAQAWKGNWDKLGNIQVNYKVKDIPFEMRGNCPVLTIDSYHHSFFKPDSIPKHAMNWPNIVVPDIRYLIRKEWKYFKIEEKDRGSESWELIV